MTTLFCDLVGFTALSDGADPEDVDRTLAGYFATARAQIEGHGGVVEKFIGDAVVGVFGVPAHEDDAERAVRAGLRIADAAAELRTTSGSALRLRIGINTGEAVVRAGVAPGSGEHFLAGDAVNTASRIQSAAPEMGVAVGLVTWELTRNAFDYVELPPAVLKGKAEAVRLFHARAPLGRVGTDVPRSHASPFVGREVDVTLLHGLFAKVVSWQSPGLVTIVGEPGLGKSRLVAELFAWVDAQPDLVRWRQGRCLPYGDGITYAALGEIVKAHAGILDSDPLDVATAKLDAVLPEGDERPWFRQRVGPLVGIESGGASSQEESFTAWRRFLEHMAADRPAVLVFEDLHWADPELLAFIEHVVDRADDVPLFVVGTARPELYERHPTFGAAVASANRINLAPLTDAETSQLIAAVLGGSVASQVLGPVLDRAGGNPLYAEELVRLLQDRDLLVGSGDDRKLRPGASVPLPDSISALIAARLDTLSAERKSILADAAVIGKVFWAGAVAAMGDRELDPLLESLREMARKDLIRAFRRSSIEGETEYAFWHVLTRDVAYAALPRASRAARHVAAAQWIEARAGERVEDQAEVLAYHYSTAVDLARASGDDARAAELEDPAFRFLSLAGERSLNVNAAAALPSLERALALAPEGHSERAPALVRFGEAAHLAGRYGDAIAALGEAVASLRTAGDVSTAARALLVLALPLGRVGDPRYSTVVSEALALLEPLGPSEALIDALAASASREALHGRYEAAARVAERALGMARELELPPPARALGFRGMARCGMGDPGGLDDYREAIVIAAEAGQGREGGVLRSNLAAELFNYAGVSAAVQASAEAIDYSRSRGLTEMATSITVATLFTTFAAGDFDSVLAVTNELVPALEASGAIEALAWCRCLQIHLHALRGDAELTRPWLTWLEAACRGTEEPQTVVQGLEAVAIARAALGETKRAAVLLEEAHAFPGATSDLNHLSFTPAVVRTALAIRGPAFAARLIEGIQPVTPHTALVLASAQAALTEAGGDLTAAAEAYADAAARWEAFGMISEQAFALLGFGRSLVGTGRVVEAQTALVRARGIFISLGAEPDLAEVEGLLMESTAT